MASSSPFHEPQPLDKKPRKSILKQRKSLEYDPPTEEVDGASEHQKKEATFDEMNILETYHPADKTYGHMKIDEPNTPYHYMRAGSDGSQPVSDTEDGGMNPNSLAARLAEDQSPPRALRKPSLPTTDSEDEPELTEEEREKKRMFEARRKKHYNEFYAVKLARQMMDTEDDEDEGEGDGEKQVTE